MEQTKILVVDDDREIVGAIAALLELEGYTVLRAYDGLEALDALHTHDVQLMILDVMMPRMDGLSATMQIRKEKNVPILLLSAKTEDADKIAGLAIGADDYITKPYNPMELVARVKAMLRRYLALGTLAGAPARENVVTLGGLSLDLDEKQLTVDGAARASDGHGIPHRSAADAEPRPRLQRGGDLRTGVERTWLQRGKHRDGTHPPHPRKNRDQPEKSQISEGGVGTWIQDGKGAIKRRLGRWRHLRWYWRRTLCWHL